MLGPNHKFEIEDLIKAEQFRKSPCSAGLSTHFLAWGGGPKGGGGGGPKILLIWTNVHRTIVAWTNVVMEVELCSIWT